MSEDQNENVTISQVKEFMKSDEFKDVIDEGVKKKISILNDHMPDMKSYRQEFVEYMMNGIDRKMEKEEKSSEKKFLSSTFRKIVNFEKSKSDLNNKYEKLAIEFSILFKYLNYVNDPYFKNILAQHGIVIDEEKSSKLENEYPALDNKTANNLKSIVDDGNNCKTAISQEIYNIKIEFEDAVPEDYKYSTSNKIGIKPNSYMKLVSTKALASIKDKKKIQNKLDTMTEDSIFNVAREEIMQEGIDSLKNQI